jgi:hypothetical protein
MIRKTSYFEEIKKANERWLARGPKKLKKTLWHERPFICKRRLEYQERDHEINLIDDIFDYGDFYERNYA